MTFRTKSLPLLILTGAMLATPALARDGQGLQANDVLLRLRGIVIAPTGTSDGILPALPGDRLNVTTSVVPEVDITWMATKNIGFELIAATAKHSAKGKQGVTQGIGNVVDTWVLPPTLTVQYHFNADGAVRPYVGAGVNYTIFWNEKATSGLAGALGPTNVHMNDSFGWAAQAGVDIDVSKRFFLNFDVKYIDMTSDVRLQTTAAGVQTVHARINPILVGVGFGLRL